MRAQLLRHPHQRSRALGSKARHGLLPASGGRAMSRAVGGEPCLSDALDVNAKALRNRMVRNAVGYGIGGGAEVHDYVYRSVDETVQPVVYYTIYHASENRNGDATMQEKIPAGYCQCGCGERTTIIAKNNAKRGMVKGEYRKFVQWHKPPAEPPAALTCEQCAKQFEIRAAEVRYKRRKQGDNAWRYCSVQCFWDARTGHLNGDFYRVCKECERELPKTAAFFTRLPNGRDGLSPTCIDCNNARTRERNAEMRREILAHYSGGTMQCGCCGEGGYSFLALDHVGGWGAEHRRKVGRNHQIYGWIKRHNFPEGFRVLCHNCNAVDGHYGKCLHEHPIASTPVREKRGRVKRRVFEHYSGGDMKCACCGEREFYFLTLDHINGGGGKERRALAGRKRGGGWEVMRALIRAGFPDGYQVLCYNCNMGKGFNGGACPHQEAA